MASMEELKPLVDIDNYNIISFLCRVERLAKRVFATSGFHVPCQEWTLAIPGILLWEELASVPNIFAPRIDWRYPSARF